MHNNQKKIRLMFVYGRTPFEAIFSDVFEDSCVIDRDKLLKIAAMKEMYDFLSLQMIDRGHSSLSRGTVITVSEGSMLFSENFNNFFKHNETRSLFSKPIDHIVARNLGIDNCDEIIRLLRSVKNKSKWLGNSACSEVEFLSFEFFSKDRFKVSELRIISSAISSFNLMFRTRKSKEDIKGQELTYIRKYFSQFLADSKDCLEEKDK